MITLHSSKQQETPQMRPVPRGEGRYLVKFRNSTDVNRDLNELNTVKTVECACHSISNYCKREIQHAR